MEIHLLYRIVVRTLLSFIGSLPDLNAPAQQAPRSSRVLVSSIEPLGIGLFFKSHGRLTEAERYRLAVSPSSRFLIKTLRGDSALDNCKKAKFWRIYTVTNAQSASLNPFHLAFPVRDIEEARAFYVGLLGCQEGRSDAHWVDFDFFGHQLVAHQKPGTSELQSIEADPQASNSNLHNPVDGHDVPVPHFGVVLPWDTWQQLAERLRDANIPFVIEPYIRFEGQVGEQATMFFLDPSGNALEFKAFKDPSQLFAK